MNRRYRVHQVSLLACLIAGCSSDDRNDSNEPVVISPDATAAATAMRDQMGAVLPQLGNVHAALTFVLNPDSGLTPGVTLVPDQTPGASPHSYTFDGIVDNDGDSISETTLSGQVTYAGDPSSFEWSPMTGQATVDIEVPVVGRVYHADVAFTMTDTEVRLSGSGTYTEPVTGGTTTIDVPAADPVIVRPAPGADGLVANACGYNVDGSLSIQLARSTGTLGATMLFSPNSSSVAVQDASFRNPANETTAMPDSTVTLTCRGGGTIDDWVGVYDQYWACLPIEHGHAQLGLTASGAAVLSVTDEDPPGSGDINTFSATLLDGSPHAAQGFFDGGPADNRYREHFTWVLGRNDSFSQWSRYEYMTGSNQGAGGVCAAVARKMP